MVQEGRGHAAIDVWAIGEALCGRYLSFAERESPRLLRVQGYSIAGESLAGSGEWHRQSPESCGATPPPRRRPRVSCNDSAMARRARGSPPKAGEACAQRGVKNLCRGTVGWRRCGSEQGSCSRPGRVLRKAVGTDHGRTDVGKRLEPGADRPSPAGGLRGRRDRCASAMKPSIKALFVQGRGALRRELTACLRTGRVLRMPRARTRGRGKAFISPEIAIQPTSGRRRPIAPCRATRRRPYPGSWEFSDQHLGWSARRASL